MAQNVIGSKFHCIVLRSIFNTLYYYYYYYNYKSTDYSDASLKLPGHFIHVRFLKKRW